MNVRLFQPSFGQEELEAVKGAFDRSWVGLGPKVNEFEKAWAEKVGAETAIGLNSATAALHLALRVFGFEKGKKVMVPSLTFSSTASAVLYNDLVPVFVDSDPETLSMDLEDMKRKYDEDVVAVMAVHFGGHPVPMDELMPWAKEKGLRVIEDCAHTTGSLYKGTPLGMWGDIGCYSFEEKKLMTTGDGGMMCTNNPDLFKEVKAMRWVGIDKDNWKSSQEYVKANKDAMHWYYELNVLGFKYNMNDLAASIGLVQMQKLDGFNAHRSACIKRYLEGLQGVPGIRPLLPYAPVEYAYWLFALRAERRDELMIHLKGKGIANGSHYTPLSVQPLFKPWGENCPFVEKEADSFITLPLHAELSNEEVDYVIEAVKAFYA